MCRSRAKNAVDPMSGTPRHNDGPTLDAIVNSEWTWWESDAVAAITAMREPTEAMKCLGGTEYGMDVGDLWRELIDEVVKP